MENEMEYTIACGDVMPGCPARFHAPTRDDLLGQVAGHAGEVHGITEFPPAVLAAVDGAIRAA
jgi:predicted small metal-binding protein